MSRDEQTDPPMFPCRTADGPRPGIRFRSVLNPRTSRPCGVGYTDERGEMVRYHCHGEQDADGTFVLRPFAVTWKDCVECCPPAPPEDATREDTVIAEYLAAKDALDGCATSCDYEAAHLRYKRALEALRAVIAPAAVARVA